MTMPLPFLTTMLSCLALASARDNGKFLKTVPTISNSLVNLGKMEISFYFNGKHPDISSKSDATHFMHDFYSSPQVSEPDCPCTNFKPSGPSFLSDPTEIINKILKSNDLFKDPTYAMCCNSHEHMQESTLFFELAPNQSPNYNAPRNINSLPLQGNPIVQRSSVPLPPLFFNKPSPAKPKAVEILLFPRRKDMATFEFTNFLPPMKKETLLKPDIQVVGDREMVYKQPSASVKKDLTLIEKRNKQEVTAVADDTVAPEQELQTDAPPVTKISNTL